MPQYLGPISATFDASLSLEKVLANPDPASNFKLYPSFTVNGSLEDSNVMKVNWGPKKQTTKFDGEDFTYGLADTADVQVKLRKQITNDANLVVTFDVLKDDGTSSGQTKAELVVNTSDNNTLKLGVESSDLSLSKPSGISDLCSTNLNWFVNFSTDLPTLPIGINVGNNKVTFGYDSNKSSQSQFSLGLLNVQNSNEECLKELQKYTLEDFLENKDCLPQTQISGGKIAVNPANITQGWELDLYSLNDMQYADGSATDQNMNFVCSMKVKETEKTYFSDTTFDPLDSEDTAKTSINYIGFNAEVRRCLNESSTDYMGLNFVASDDTWVKATVGCRTDFEGFSGFYGEDPNKTQSCFGNAFVNASI